MSRTSFGRRLWVTFLTCSAAWAQDLIPRAYLVTPMGSNAITLSHSWNDGELVFDPSVPVEDAKGRFHTSVLSYYHGFGLLGRSANIVVSIPYARGDFEGRVLELQNQASRSGLADARLRLSVNVVGGPAMGLGDYVQWREKGLMGISLTAVVPTGQNDPARVVNPGTNRWAFKPELGITRRVRRWVGEGYAGVWLFTPNPKFFPGNANRTQRPMPAFEGHLGYYLKPRLWASFDVNFWSGGSSAVDSVAKRDTRQESRIGGSVSFPLMRHQSLKVSYSRGAITRIGGNFTTLAAAWQYSWITKPQ